MSNIDIANRFFEANTRISKIIYLAAAGLPDSLCDDLEELLNDSPNKELAKIFGTLPEHLKEEEDSAEAFAEWLLYARRFGFLMQFETPVMRHYGNSGRTFSWGYYESRWVYGDSLDEALTAGQEWVKSVRAREKAEAVKS